MIEAPQTENIKDAYQRAHEERSRAFIAIIRKIFGLGPKQKTSDYANWGHPAKG